MGYIKSIGTVIVYIGFFLAVITYLPGLPPTGEYSEYSIKLPVDVQHQFELKNQLRGPEVLFSGEIRGPEYFAAYNGKLYTGIRGGYVVQIEEDRLIPIVKFGQKCDGLWQEEKCGRPLGLKFNDKGELFVADAYYGIFKVDINTRQYVNIVNSSIPIDGMIPRLVNSLDIAKNGDIYWSYSSSDYSLHNGLYSFLTNPTGSLVRYNAKTKKNEILIKNVGFANGVLLSDDESFVLVADCQNSRIVKYHLKGPKVGQQEFFAEGLPGLPDNIHTDGQGGFLVSLILSIDSQHPALHQSLIPHPHIRKMLSRLLYLIEAPFKLLEDIYPNYYSEKVLHTVSSLELVTILDTQKTSILLRMDKTGKILDALYSDDKKVQSMCSAYIHNEYLWLGSPWNDCIMRVPLKQAFPDLTVNKQSSNTKRQDREEPLLTASNTPNVRVETKPTNAKPVIKQETITKPSPEPNVKVQTTQNINTASKPTTSKSTSQSATTTPKPASSTKEVKKNMSKEVKKDTSKETKKDASKEIKKDTSKEMKKDNSNSQTKSEILNKNNKATVNSENDSAKNTVRETQSAKSKSVEKKNDSPKK